MLVQGVWMLGWILELADFSVLQEMHLKLQGPPAKSSHHMKPRMGPWTRTASTGPAVSTPPPRFLFFGVPTRSRDELAPGLNSRAQTRQKPTAH